MFRMRCSQPNPSFIFSHLRYSMCGMESLPRAQRHDKILCFTLERYMMPRSASLSVAIAAGWTFRGAIFGRFWLCLCFVGLLATAPIAFGRLAASVPTPLYSVEARIQTIMYRLAVGSADLCHVTVPTLGFVVHDLSQYGGRYKETARVAYHFNDDPQVLAVVAASPAYAAGLRAGDALISVAEAPLPRSSGVSKASFERTAAILAQLEGSAARGPLVLGVRRGDRSLRIRFEARLGCPAHVQIARSKRIDARADGVNIELTTSLIDFTDNDDQLAAVVAHELAHNILEHAARLRSAKVSTGIFHQFGKSAELTRLAEDDADRLSVHLLHRSGYSPAEAISFWRKSQMSGRTLFHSPTHRGAADRARLISQEVSTLDQQKSAGTCTYPEKLSELSRLPACAVFDAPSSTLKLP